MADLGREATRRARIEWLSLFDDNDDAGASAGSVNAGAGNGGGAGAGAGADAGAGDAGNGVARAWTDWSIMSDLPKGLLIAGLSMILVVSLAYYLRHHLSMTLQSTTTDFPGGSRY